MPLLTAHPRQPHAAETDKAHAAERLADQRTRAAEADRNAEAARADLARLSTELAELRRQLAETTQSADRPGRTRTGTKDT